MLGEQLVMELRLLDAELRSDEVIRLLVAARERVPEGVRATGALARLD
jgi:hypothetical protein